PYGPGDPPLKATKEVEFIAATGDAEAVEGDNKAEAEETPSINPTNLNLTLQLLPPIETTDGRKWILGYMGYTRKRVCKDYRRESTGICRNPKTVKFYALKGASINPALVSQKITDKAYSPLVRAGDLPS